MITPLRHLQEFVLSADASEEVPGDPFLSRAYSAIRSLREGPSRVGPADVAALLRQGMLRSHLARQDAPELRIPRADPWPDERMWARFNCDATVAGAMHFLVRARRWEPSWFEPNDASVVDAAMQEQPRRQLQSVPADPRVTEFTAHTEYASRGQCAAVRAAFLMPAGSTVIVNLPTGAGKTLAFQLPALTWASEAGLTLVVVPTVALARDQEERFRAFLAEHQQGRAWSGMPLAYHGGLDAESKRAIRAAIRNGTVPIVFASAEAVTGALRGPLFEAARQGRLRIFAIDEAHIVSQWGQQFRPEFQSIVGLRDTLLAACPPEARFRTLLLTATLTAESYETLRDLFGQGGFQVVSAAALRPEPGFLLHTANSETERCDRVIDAIRHLPRPLILYTTLREHAEYLYEQLRVAGFARLSLVRGGDLADASGERVLHDWRSRALDVIVATSAFGLGVDQSEVRSVVHACLPETIDRYYQEVGRVGRDGNAAVALLISTPDDVRTAEALAQEKLISVDRAFERWDAMWVRRRSGTDEDYLLSLDDRPADIPDTGVRNASWNLRTLVLMARAGLITFAAHQPPVLDRAADENDSAFEERQREENERYAREVAIRVRDPRHSDRAHWNDVVARTRAELRAADEEASRLVRTLRNLQRPLNEIFADVYSLSDPIVRPVRLAGSCPVTRRNGTASFVAVDPEVTTLARTAATVSESLERSLGPSCDDAGRAWIAYEPVGGDARDQRRWRDRLLNLLRYAVSGGIVEFSVPGELLREEDWHQLCARSPLRFLIRTSDAGPSSIAPLGQELLVPRLTLLAERDAVTATVEHVMRIHRPRHVLVLPRDLADPTRPYRRFFDVVRHLSFEDLMSRLAS